MNKAGSLLLSAFLFPLFSAAAPIRCQEPSTGLTPNTQLMKTDLLVVTAHPDDESMMAATMARYADEGRVVSLVVCTHGEGGGNSTGKESGAALGAVREAELRRCLGLLGTRYLYFLNQPDWAYTESVRATLSKWGHHETLKRLVRLIRILKPTVIATMDPAPSGGQHGHHQAAGRLAAEAFDAAANRFIFPELQEEEGLAPWTVSKLYWTGGGSNSRTEIDIDGAAHGVLAASSPGKRYSQVARLAESNHRSQGFDKFFGSAPAADAPAFPNRFMLVKSRVCSELQRENDLFATSGEIDSQRSTPNRFGTTFRIEPSPAVRNYRAWLQANSLDRLMSRLPAHVPVTIGSPSKVVVDVHARNWRIGRVTIALPEGWRADALTKEFSDPGTGASVTFWVKAPASAKIRSYDFTARLEGRSESDSGKLDALPLMRVRRLRHPLTVDGDVTKWEAAGIAPLNIPATNVAQGFPGKEEEASGRFFVAYDQTGIQVLVDVTDDTVVHNIAPDDIKAHWRSTSTEICIDPAPRSENTLSSLKLGIFPADTSGRVRAARDADANPGPVDRKEPSIRLASRIRPGGYVVEARIPWSALRTSPAFHPRSGRQLGFNIILYHAGKKDARPGEDINKSRLAWSFWNGVWGRPEIWGTAVLD